MSIADIVSVNISLTTRTPTRKGFGTPCVAVSHSHYADRSRTYQGLDGMVSDGFAPNDSGYMAVAAIFSQTPRPPSVMVGRRALAWTQLVDLTPATPSLGLVYTITIAGVVITRTSVGVDLPTECTGLAAAINAVPAIAASATSILATGGASAVGAQDYTGAQLNGTTGGSAMNPPRAPSLVLSNHTDWDATSATFTGTDGNGVVITDTFAIPNNGNATVLGAGSKLFATITNIHIPGQTGTGGTFTVGVRARAIADGSSGTKVVVTTQRASELVSYVHDSVHSNISLKCTTTDPGIATDLAAIFLDNPDFYGLTLDSNSAAEIAAAAAWAESNGGVFFDAHTCDTAVSDVAMSSDTTSIKYTLKHAGYTRTHLDFLPEIGTQTGKIAQAIQGSRLPQDPGSDTWSFKSLPGINATNYTSTQITNLNAGNVGYYTTIAGVAVTQGGKTPSGEWVDVIRFRDWLVARLQEAVFALLINNAKVPYTDAGISTVKAAVAGVLGDGVRAGGLAATPKPFVTAPAAADVDAATKATRVLPNVNFGATLAGAIHAVQISGTVTS